MRYPEFRRQRLCVGSGLVESGYRTVVGRLKRSGMYWTMDGEYHPRTALLRAQRQLRGLLGWPGREPLRPSGNPR